MSIPASDPLQGDVSFNELIRSCRREEIRRNRRIQELERACLGRRLAEMSPLTEGDLRVLREFETPLSKAVRESNVRAIKDYLQTPGMDVNAVDGDGHNALESAFLDCELSEESCRALIQFGINLEHRDRATSWTALGRASFYRIERTNKLFRCLLEGGADLDARYDTTAQNPSSIRDKIQGYPELLEIVQGVARKRANLVFSALGNEPGLTKLACEMLGDSLGEGWKPSIIEEPLAQPPASLMNSGLRAPPCSLPQSEPMEQSAPPPAPRAQPRSAPLRQPHSYEWLSGAASAIIAVVAKVVEISNRYALCLGRSSNCF